MYAPTTTAKPTKINEIILTAAGGTQYDPATGWFDLGATREGIQVSVSNTETGFDIDQVAGQVLTAPDEWEVFVTTRFAEVTLEKMAQVWEGSAITTDTSVTPYEREAGYAGATSYTQRRMAVIFRKPTGNLLAFIFWLTARSPQEAVLDFRKTELLQLPARFKAVADTSVVDSLKQFFIVREQI